VGFKETIQRVGQILTTVAPDLPVFRNVPGKGAKPPFIVWGETGSKSSRSDGGKIGGRALLFQVDLYDAAKLPELPDMAEKIFQHHKIAFGDPEMFYEADFKAERWTWECEVLML